MGVWLPPSIEDQPFARLERWCIVRVLDKPLDSRYGLHLCGYMTADMEGRFTSAIRHIDLDKKTVRTRSGRLYYLGEPGFDKDAEWVMGIWLDHNNVSEIEILHSLEDVFTETDFQNEGTGSN